MKRLTILIGLLLLTILGMSSCRMRTVGVYRGSHFQARHTRHHWGRERHQNVRRMYWGKHKYGMRPYRHRGQIRY